MEDGTSEVFEGLNLDRVLLVKVGTVGGRIFI